MCSIHIISISILSNLKTSEKPGFPKSEPQKPSFFFLYANFMQDAVKHPLVNNNQK
jgi:hypothetical protein